MRRRFDRLLSQGIASLQQGASIEEFMRTPAAARMRSGQREELHSLLLVASELVPLQTVSFPPPQAQIANRARFLGQAAQWREERASHRPHAWTGVPLRALRGLLAIALVAAIVAAVAIVPAAASSLPDSRLYVLKTTLEDARVALTLDPSARADLCLSLADLRTSEMLRLKAESRPANDAVVARLEHHLQMALQAAQATRGAAQYFWLQRIVAHADDEETQLRQANLDAPAATQPMLSDAADVADRIAGQARQMLQELPVPLPSATPPETRTSSPTASTTEGAPTDTPTPEVTAAWTPTPTDAGSTRPVGATEPAPLTHTPAPATPTATTTAEPSATPSVVATAKPATVAPSHTPTRRVSPTRTPSGTWTLEPTSTPTGTRPPTHTPTVATETPEPTQPPVPVYEFSLKDNPDPVPAGSRIHYNVLLRNVGEVPLTTVKVTVSYSQGCAYYPPNNPGFITWPEVTVEPHTYWAVEFTLDTYSTAAGCTVSAGASMTCDQGTAGASTTTRVGPAIVPTRTPTVTLEATPTATPTTTSAPQSILTPVTTDTRGVALTPQVKSTPGETPAF